MTNGDKICIGREISVEVSAIAELARQNHIRRITLFGSAARGEMTSQSDIDLIVEFEPGKAPSLGGSSLCRMPSRRFLAVAR